MTYKLLPALGVALSALVMTGCGSKTETVCTPHGGSVYCREVKPQSEPGMALRLLTAFANCSNSTYAN